MYTKLWTHVPLFLNIYVLLFVDAKLAFWKKYYCLDRILEHHVWLQFLLIIGHVYCMCHSLSSGRKPQATDLQSCVAPLVATNKSSLDS